MQKVVVKGQARSVSLRTPLAHLPTVIGGVLFVVVGASMLAVEFPNVVTSGLGVGCLVFGAWAAVNAARARLTVTVEQVLEQGDLLPKRLLTSELQKFYVDRAPHVLPWYCVWVLQDSEECRAIESCRVLGEGVAHDDLRAAVAELNGWIERHPAVR